MESEGGTESESEGELGIESGEGTGISGGVGGIGMESEGGTGTSGGIGGTGTESEGGSGSHSVYVASTVAGTAYNGEEGLESEEVTGEEVIAMSS